MTRLYLTRHGQTEWNLIGRMQGSMESNLTDLGMEQARNLGQRLHNTHFDAAYASSSGRAMHTARLILGDRTLPLTGLDELKEMNLGYWEGVTFEEIKAKYAEQFHMFWKTPHLLKECPGETFQDLQARVVGAITKIIEENPGKDVLVVAHAIVLKFALSHFEQLPLERVFDERIIQPASLSIVEITDSGAKVVLYGDTGHY